MTRVTRLLFCVLVAWCGVVAPTAGQQRLRLVENDVKAGLIFSFLLYTTWPDAGGAPLSVCLWNRDTLDGRLAPIARRTAAQQRIELRVITRTSELAACSLLFVGASEMSAWPALQANQGQQTLTVSDGSGFARSGGMIEIFEANGHLNIRVNRPAIGNSRLSVSDRLLRLADASGGGR